MRPNSSCGKRERQGLSATDAYEFDRQRCEACGDQLSPLRAAHPVPPCYGLTSYMEACELTYFAKGIAKIQLKRDQKALLLASVRAGRSAPSHGMSKEEAVTMLAQDIADYDEILARLRRHDGS